jgi:hypothetical protein
MAIAIIFAEIATLVVHTASSGITFQRGSKCLHRIKADVMAKRMGGIRGQHFKLYQWLVVLVLFLYLDPEVQGSGEGGGQEETAVVARRRRRSDLDMTGKMDESKTDTAEADEKDRTASEAVKTTPKNKRMAHSAEEDNGQGQEGGRRRRRRLQDGQVNEKPNKQKKVLSGNGDAAAGKVGGGGETNGIHMSAAGDKRKANFTGGSEAGDEEEEGSKDVGECPFCDPNFMDPGVEEALKGYDVPSGDPNPGKCNSGLTGIETV